MTYPHRRRVLADLLQDFKKVIMGRDVMHATSPNQTLHDANMLGAELRPSKKQIPSFRSELGTVTASAKKYGWQRTPKCSLDKKKVFRKKTGQTLGLARVSGLTPFIRLARLPRRHPRQARISLANDG
jgi:hypothetical protein